jgi:hypothetical protein
MNDHLDFLPSIKKNTNFVEGHRSIHVMEEFLHKCRFLTEFKLQPIKMHNLL